MLPIAASPRYFTPCGREFAGADRGMGVSISQGTQRAIARAILFRDIMLDSSSSSARLDILDVIGSNLLYHPVSTDRSLQAARPPPPARRCIYVRWNDRYISPACTSVTIRTKNIAVEREPAGDCRRARERVADRR
jgi:hypothetical protein